MLFYNGMEFHGFQRQPNVRTVEDLLLSVLRKCLGERPQNFSYASRTDAGASALYQVVAFTIPRPLRNDHYELADFLVECINDFLRPEVVVWGFRTVEGEFHARYWALCRTYVYLLKGVSELNDVALEVLRLLRGYCDVSFLSVGIKGVKMYLRKATPLKWRENTVLIVEAERFPRGFVRRLAGLVSLANKGRVSVEDVRACLAGGRCKINPPALTPKSLALLKVTYSFAFLVKSEWLRELASTLAFWSDKHELFSLLLDLLPLALGGARGSTSPR